MVGSAVAPFPLGIADAWEVGIVNIPSENAANVDRLVEQLKLPRGVIPFVGAGVSVPFGMPGWSDFLLEQGEEAGIRPEITSLLDAGGYEEAAQRLLDAQGHRAFGDAIGDTYGEDRLAAYELRGAVSWLPELATGPVITTNFDRVLERAFEQAAKPFAQVISGAKSDLAVGQLQAGRHVLLKIHGDYDADRVLTKTEYEQAYGAVDPVGQTVPELNELVKLIFIVNALLFIGCSLRHDRTTGILKAVSVRNPGLAHYAVVEAPEDRGAFLARRAELSRMGIRPIWYESGRHEQIDELLEHLLKPPPPPPPPPPPDGPSSYRDFGIRIERDAPGVFRASVQAPEGDADARFELPFNELELENLILRIGRSQQGVRGKEKQREELERMKSFGERLFDAVFRESVGDMYRAAKAAAAANKEGVRITLALTEVPELMYLPWEYLYDRPEFLSTSTWTPIVRYLDSPVAPRLSSVRSPLRILGVVSSPREVGQLAAAHERKLLDEALAHLTQDGLIEVTWLEKATLPALQQALREKEYHVLHYIGHGEFDRDDGAALLFEDGVGRGRPESGERLATLLADHRSLRLAVLNACEGARTARDDPFAGVASRLVERGIPAVVAMQFEITDQAAILFAREFYSALGARVARGDDFSVDAAIAEARKAIYVDGNDIEWGTPVLFMRVDAPQPAPPAPPPSPVPPIADFSAEPASGAVPLAVKFADLSSGNPESWSWELGDGRTSDVRNPSHVYADPGTYTVTLTVANAGGEDSKTKVDDIVVTGRRWRNLVLVCAAVAVAAIGGIVGWRLLGGDESETSPPNPATTTPTETEPSTPAIIEPEVVVERAGLPAWSPDGSRIAFARQINEVNVLFVANADGSNQKQIPLPSTQEAAWPTWSDAGLAFNTVGGDDSDVYLLPDPDSDQPPLRAAWNKTGASDSQPAWSRDGTKLAFSSIRRGNWDIWWVAGADTATEATQLTLDDNRHEQMPAWSPDGTEVAFISRAKDRCDSGDLYIVSTNGTGLRPLVADAGDALHPSWSPDGRIVFSSNVDGDYDLYVVDPDAPGGVAPDRITDTAEDDFGPTWSPDGERIAFARGAYGRCRAQTQDVYAMDAPRGLAP